MPGAITMKHREIEANGISLHFVEEGQGPAGFHGPLNYYRAVDPFTRNSAAFAGAKIRQPSMFLAGTLDGLNLVAQPSSGSMRSNLTDLRSFIILDGVGHWPQLEAPDRTNAA